MQQVKGCDKRVVRNGAMVRAMSRATSTRLILQVTCTSMWRLSALWPLKWPEWKWFCKPVDWWETLGKDSGWKWVGEEDSPSVYSEVTTGIPQVIS